jgi:hypothetical protein
MSTSRAITSSSVKGIMNKRALVKAEQIGRRVVLTVQGDGNTVDVKDKEGNYVQSVVEPGTVLQKRIFNAKANSEIAMKNPRNRQYLIDAIAAEKAGDTAKADELFSAYLNAVQISFSVVLPNAVASKLGNNVEISGKVQEITTEKGSLLTIDPSSISVTAPELCVDTKFSFDEFMPQAENINADALSTEA